MKFDLRTPCPQCPFRSDIPAYLTPARVTEIDRSLIQATFPCHKTTQFDEDGEVIPSTPGERHCAGALIILEKLGRPSQMMRIAERLGLYDMRKLDMQAPVFNSFRAMRNAQPKRRARP